MIDRALKKILHVEDEADIRAVAKLALEAFGGFEVESCESGADALAKAPAFRPDLMLLDVMMPGMDGPMTLEALRNLPGFGLVPAVFMTAKAQVHEIEKLRSLGAIDVVVKPFDPEALAAQIADIWRRIRT